MDSWDTEMIMRMVLMVTDFHSVVKTFHLVSITSFDKEPLYYNNKGKGNSRIFGDSLFFVRSA